MRQIVARVRGLAERVLARFGMRVRQVRGQLLGLAMAGGGDFRVGLAPRLVIAAAVPDGVVLRLRVPNQVQSRHDRPRTGA